jgi:hypothetical protein
MVLRIDNHQIRKWGNSARHHPVKTRQRKNFRNDVDNLVYRIFVNATNSLAVLIQFICLLFYVDNIQFLVVHSWSFFSILLVTKKLYIAIVKHV